MSTVSAIVLETFLDGNIDVLTTMDMLATISFLDMISSCIPSQLALYILQTKRNINLFEGIPYINTWERLLLFVEIQCQDPENDYVLKPYDISAIRTAICAPPRISLNSYKKIVSLHSIPVSF